MGRRITRKQLKKEDEFVSTVDKIMHWIMDNWKPLTAGILAMCVVAVIWWGATLWMSSRSHEASLLLSEAVSTFEGEPAAGKLEPAGDVEAAETLFQQVIDEYGRSDQADMARLYLARIALERGDADSARSVFVELTERHRGDVIGRLANLDLVQLQLAQGQEIEAAGELEAVVSGQSNALPPDVALYQLGELYYREQEPERARRYFERLTEEYPESPYAAAARQRLAALG